MKTKIILLAAVLTLYLIPYAAIPSFSQDTTSAQEQTLSYFKIEVGMHITDCPVLPTCLQGKLMAFAGIKDYNKDMKNQCIQFNTPEGVITKEQILNLAVGCGFPVQSLNILVDSKPFSN